MNIVSLYDETGHAMKPWAIGGFTCYCFDLINKNHSQYFINGGAIHWIKADMRSDETFSFIVSLEPRFIASWPPCTDLTNAGSRHWVDKWHKNPNFQYEALELVQLVEIIAFECNAIWFAENPIGKVSSLWRKPDFIFNPSDYGGYLSESDVHPHWPEIYPPRDAYFKSTCLWAGGGFVMPERKIVFCKSVENPGWRKLGGKSERTKRIRSESPRGFCEAVYAANSILLK